MTFVISPNPNITSQEPLKFLLASVALLEAKEKSQADKLIGYRYDTQHLYAQNFSHFTRLHLWNNYQQLFIYENLKPRNACLTKLFVKSNIVTSPPPGFKLRRSLTQRNNSKIGNDIPQHWGGGSMNASPNPEFNIGDRCSWTSAPDWWNPAGEKIRAIEGDTALLDYSGIAIPISNLILINCAPKPESSPANKLKEFPKVGIASVNQGVAA